MASERFDFVAFNEMGAYAICLDDGRPHSRKFVTDALRLGHRIERLPVKEAADRHMDYIRATWRAPAQVAALATLPQRDDMEGAGDVG